MISRMHILNHLCGRFFIVKSLGKELCR